MERLSKAGKLYLKEYYILKEAESDVNNYLNEIVEKTYQQLLEKKELIPVPKHFSWNLWKNQASPGIMQIYPVAPREVSTFEKDKIELILQYSDVRHESKLTETDAVSIGIHSTNTLRKKLKQLPSKLFREVLEIAEAHGIVLNFDQRVNYSSQVQLNLDNAADSSNTIADFIIERCEGMEAFISKILEQAGELSVG